jgi:hypothetical protein
MKILKSPAEYAGRLQQHFGGDVPATAVFDAAREYPQVPASFFVEVQQLLANYPMRPVNLEEA